MKAPFAYYGGKMGMASEIISLMPPHSTYLEPYLGSGAVFFAKQPSTIEILNDLDGSVTNLFTQLWDNTEALIRVCALTPYARDEWENARGTRTERLWVNRPPNTLFHAGQH